MNKSGKLSKRLWFNMILFGFMGQVAWNVENMYFNTFLYKEIYSNGASQAAIDGAMPVMSAISIMVGLSAATAVITTFIMGTLSDKMNKRKVFISVGYIAWGITTGIFGFISRDNIASLFHLSNEVQILSATVWAVIVMDSVMTFMGSTSNDSAFNAWVTQVTDPVSRPKVESVFAALPIVAMGGVIGIGTLAQTGKISYSAFFLCLGAFVVLCGIVGLFTLQEPEYKEESEAPKSNYWADLFYGFRPSVIKENAKLYLALAAGCFYSIAVQVFFPYLLIYLQYVIMPASEGLELLSAKVIVPAVISVVLIVVGLILLIKIGGKKGKAYALIPSAVLFVIGLVGAGFVHDLVGILWVIAPLIIGYAALMIMLNSAVRDFTPVNKAGLFQGIRMIFYVLLPMIIGPAIGNFASVNSGIQYTNEYNVVQVAPTSNMFVYAGIVAAFVFIPLAVLVKKGFDVKEEN